MGVKILGTTYQLLLRNPIKISGIRNQLRLRNHVKILGIRNQLRRNPLILHCLEVSLELVDLLDF